MQLSNYLADGGAGELNVVAIAWTEGRYGFASPARLRSFIRDFHPSIRVVHANPRVEKDFAPLVYVPANFAFDGKVMRVIDRVDGTSRRTIVRHLHTGHAVSRRPGGAVIEGKARRYRLTTDGEIKLSRGTCWTAYGEGVPSTIIDITLAAPLPVETEFAVQAL